jgi:hypothetical protein
MNKSILGKILLFFIFSLELFAAVSAKVDKTQFFLGDVVTLTIQANGEDLEFPNINKIGDFIVEGTSQSQQISIINGNKTVSKSVQYTFSPNKSMTIPSFEVNIKNTKIKTNPIHIEMVKPHASTTTDPIQLEIKTNKDSYYVGEPIISTIYFRYKNNLPLIDAKLDTFEPDGFWKKEMQSPKPKQINGYITYQINNLLFAKQAGDIEIPNQFVNIAKRDSRNFIRWEKVFSNTLNLKIKPLPQGVNNLGSYTIQATVDKTKVKANEPVNLTIIIDGNGNFEDINEFKLSLPKQVLYSSKPEIQTSVLKNKVMGNFVQKISIISDESYTIPAISFSYFDIESQSIKTIQTKEIKIEVEKTVQKQTPKIQTLQTPIEPQILTKTQSVEKDSNLKYIFGLVGLILGALITFISLKLLKPKKIDQETPLIKQIKKAKDDKTLYDILLPYIKDNTIQKYIKELENNLYNKGSSTINKKQLIEYILENYEL